MLSIFSAPKPFKGHIGIIQENAIASWKKLGEGVEVLLLGDEQGMAESALRLGVSQHPEIARNELGTPLMDSIFQTAREIAKHDLLAYVNADIILLSDLMRVVRIVGERFSEFLVVGERWDMDQEEPLSFSAGWEAGLLQRLELEGRKHPPRGSDYFIFPRHLFEAMPAFALGRAGWDNWMIYAARAGRIPVIDASGSLTAIHQNHDYHHLPDGKSHYRLPESDVNRALAGGTEMIFTLQDTNWRVDNHQVMAGSSHQPGWIRKLEAGLYVRFGPGCSSRAVRMLFHPRQMGIYWRDKLRDVFREGG